MATSRITRVKLEEKYDEVIMCSNGFINVRRNARYGYLNESGLEITALKYEAPADFNNGFAIVKYNREYLRLDESGRESVI